MQSSFVKAICQVGTFMICAQAIVHFRPKASYEKYLKMLVSAMILIQLLVSFGGIFTVDGEKKLAVRAEWFANSLDESMQKSMENSVLAGDLSLDIVGEDPRQSESVNEGKMRAFEKTDVQKIIVEVEPIAPVCGVTEGTEVFMRQQPGAVE